MKRVLTPDTWSWDDLRNLVDDVIRLSIAAALVEFAGFEKSEARRCAAIFKIKEQPFFK